MVTMSERRGLRRRRNGFTLIELLIAVAIISFLFGIAVLVAPVLQSDKSTQAAQDLQGWLEISKNRSIRDGSLRGIRLIVDTANANQARQFQYVAQPEPFTGGQINVTEPNLTFSAIDPTNGHGNANLELWSVQVGDFVEIGSGSEAVRRIVGINPGPVFVLSPHDGAIPPAPRATTNYRVYRRPRPIAGEEVLTFPEGVIVDLQRSQLGNRDIMFGAGAVVSQQGRGKVILWVRDGDRDATNPGEQSLVTVYTRSGVIVTHPVDTDSADPYSFTRELRPSGQ